MTMAQTDIDLPRVLFGQSAVELKVQVLVDTKKGDLCPSDTILCFDPDSFDWKEVGCDREAWLQDFCDVSKATQRTIKGDAVLDSRFFRVFNKDRRRKLSMICHNVSRQAVASPGKRPKPWDLFNFLQSLDEISTNVFLGGAMVALNHDALSTNGITHVLCCAVEYTPLPEFISKVVSADDDDEYDLSAHFDEAADFIDEALAAGGRVYVQCAHILIAV